MKFSMPSFFIGVATVVGAIALGFGGGVMLTGSAIKDTAVGSSRVERAAHAEPARVVPIKSDAPRIEASLLGTPAALPAGAVQPASEAAPATATPPGNAAPAPPAGGNQAVVPLATQTASPPPADRVTASAVAPVVARGDEPLMTRQDLRTIRSEQRARDRAERRRYYAEQREKRALARSARRALEVDQTRPEMAFEREDAGFDFFGRTNAPMRSPNANYRE